MHELSIAMSILEMLQEESQNRAGARVAAVHLKVGLMAGVLNEALQSAFEMAREGTAFSDCRIVITDVGVTVYCPKCAQERAVVSVQDMSCSICGTVTGEIVHGRELEVVALEIEE